MLLFRCFLLLALISFSQLSQAGWRDYLNDLKESVKEETVNNSHSSLSEDVIVDGLKQALNQGVDKAIKQLGKENGFLGDAAVKIPMPETLKKVEKGLRKLGQQKTADRFVNTMNRAAEQAVPKTTDIFISALKNMSLTDAINILNGKDDAATQYFRRTSAAHLHDAIHPVVKQATNAVGVTESYKKMIKKAGFMAKYIDKDSLDIDRYVTDKAIDGLFIKIADEEKRIRQQPLARTTDLLKDVFGSIGN
ncbi:MAG: DUF4197 domain-containing protein [Gammaproteobacteria bacterium]|nr:DUF4197 domain-containing protein [Gammaproteobacteria bacterium]